MKEQPAAAGTLDLDTFKRHLGIPVDDRNDDGEDDSPAGNSSDSAPEHAESSQPPSPQGSDGEAPTPQLGEGNSRDEGQDAAAAAAEEANGEQIPPKAAGEGNGKSPGHERLRMAPGTKRITSDQADMLPTKAPSRQHLRDAVFPQWIRQHGNYSRFFDPAKTTKGIGRAVAAMERNDTVAALEYVVGSALARYCFALPLTHTHTNATGLQLAMLQACHHRLPSLFPQPAPRQLQQARFAIATAATHSARQSRSTLLPRSSRASR